MRRSFEVAVICLLASSVLINCGAKEVCIGSSDRNIRPSCELHSLNEFCHSSIPGNIVVTFIGKIHQLNTVCELRSVNNVTFRSKNESKAVIECSPEVESGLRCLHSSMVTLTGLQFRKCETTYQHLVDIYSDYSVPNNTAASLIFINGSNLVLVNVSISDTNVPGFYIYDVAENVTIDHCHVSNAVSDKLSVIGGNTVLYDYRITKPTELTISNSLIENSGALLPNLNLYSGGLVSILGTSLITLFISNTNFTRNRSGGTTGRGGRGGNMVVCIYNSSAVTISGVNFHEGYTTLAGGGLFVEFDIGGLYVGLDDLSLTPNTFFTPTVRILNSSFKDNRANLYGGGIYVSWTKSKLYPGNMSIDISDCVFRGNSLGIGKKGGGLALHIQANVNYFLSQLLPVLFVTMRVSRCEFYAHFPDTSPSNTHVAEDSVIYASNIDNFEIDAITVESNNCTAIKAVESELVFSGLTRIFNNTAVTGAGLQLTNTMLNLINPNINLTIIGNSALQTGGGIQVHASSDCSSFLSDFCFILLRAVTMSTVNLTIADNTAPEGGDNTFGVIYWACNHNWKPPHVLHVPQNELCRSTSISSMPKQVCVGVPQRCPGGNSSQKSAFGRCNISFNVTAYPGDTVSIPIYLTGELAGSVGGTILTNTDERIVILERERIQTVGLLGGSMKYSVYATQFAEEGRAYLILQAAKYDCSVGRAPIAKIQITFLNCPFGFQTTESRFDNYTAFGCTCPPNSVIVNCSIESQTITKRTGSWIGTFKQNDSLHFATNNYCPLDYCKLAFQNIQSLPESLAENEQCQYNRTGILCGSCPKGWSMVLGSSECHEKCSSVWLLLILPFALAGLLLVIVIQALNLTVTMGTVCGLIFYTNVIQDYSLEILSKRHPFPGLTSILHVFLSWFNLDLGISTCFYDGMDAFGKTLFLFVFPLYIWIISATIVVLSNRYIFFTKVVGNNALKVLSTLILLSYSKMLRVTISVLRMKSVEVYFNSSSSSSMMRWALDGNIPYLDAERHLVLFVIAVVFTMLLLPFCMLLLCIKHIYSFSNYSRLFSWIDKLRPFFDTYTGPYNNKARFWTGLLLFVRLLLVIVRALDYKNNAIPYYIIIGVCLALLFLLILLRGVYTKQSVNILEAFFISNVCLVFLTNIYEGEGSEIWISAVSHLLVGSAFLVFLGITVYHAYLKCSHHTWVKKLCIKPPTPEEDFDTSILNSMRGYEPLQWTGPVKAEN